ncbi:MAG: cadherin repeat domain-containing protein, partial [Planctomycetia bacterium]|nr:cadherin repeat domain-containing protein [Planctomycetia bacterium]
RPYDGTTTVTVSGGSLVGVVGLDAVSLVGGGNGTGTMADANIGTGKPVTVTGYALTGTAAGNYSLAQPTGVTVDILGPVGNQAPTGVALANVTSLIAENTSTAAPIKVADIVITDDLLGTNSITLAGADAGSFLVSGTGLYLKPGVVLDFEAQQSYAVTVNVADTTVAGSVPVSANVTLGLTDVNDMVPVFTSGATGSVAENSPISTPIYTAVVSDADGTPANRAVSYSIKAGVGDAAFVQIDPATGVVTLLAAPVFATKPSYAFTVVATNAGTGATLVAEQAVDVAVTTVNAAPTGVSLANVTSAIAENSFTLIPIQVADIVIADDPLGTNTITLTGADAGSFLVGGPGLYLKAGVVLDFEAKQTYAVTVNVADTTVAGSVPVSTDFTLALTDVNDWIPVFTSGARGSVAENAPISTPIYTAVVTDADGTPANR